ncbi:hypothetical protein [Candidatus Venteria ishoeyi]|uniref:Uncharacterized protein n=1 Tax=Candidatus Venteria ishoeyi TaxID=1899563 RepID=A0A1H6FB93_9GAMM|nr:hypothetical protein [Candidatus Venteria ishoeyi]SEH07357.1 Uncharacterised protein [Candidatus Venteria ishoeyi]
MTSAERIQYLANVLYFFPKENPELVQSALFTQICNTLEAEETEVLKAQQYHQEKGFKVTPIGIFSRQVSNLEDMLLFAFQHEQLDAADKKVLLSFSKTLGFSQQQIQMLASQSRERLLQQTQWEACWQCGTQKLRSFRFCPECGAHQKHTIALLESQKKQSPCFDPKKNKGLCLAFDQDIHSDVLLHLARSAPKYQEIAKSEQAGEHLWSFATWPQQKILDALPLATQLSKQSETQRGVYIEGVPQPWERCFAFLDCLQQRQCTYHPAEHCFGLNTDSPNIWGCQRAQLNWDKDASWLCDGQFESEQVFCLDKAKINHRLQTNLQNYHLCPFLQLKKIEQMLSQLPEKILIDQKNWGYQKITKERPGAITLDKPQQFAIGVAPLQFDEAQLWIKKIFEPMW